MVMLITAMLAGGVAAGEFEALPYGDLEYLTAPDGAPARGVWARCGQVSVADGWTVSRQQAASGKVCARGAKAGSELVIGGECGGGQLIGTVKLRADAPTKATVRLSWFNRLNRVDEKRTVDLTTAWQTVELTTSSETGGAVELAVAPAGEVAIAADDFSIKATGPGYNEQVEDPRPVPRQPLRLSGLQDYSGQAKGRTGEVPLRLLAGTGPAPVPYVWGGVPLPKGTVYDRRCVQVTAAGQPVTAQLDVLARWAEDQSIQALLITLPLSVAQGTDRLALRYAASPPAAAEPKPALAVTETKQAVTVATGSAKFEFGSGAELLRVSGAGPAAAIGLSAAGLHGAAAEDEPGWLVVERSGPLAAVVCRRQQLGTLTAETRVSLFAGSARALVSACFINQGGRCVVGPLGLTGCEGAFDGQLGAGETAAGAGLMNLPGGAKVGLAVRDFADNAGPDLLSVCAANPAAAWPAGAPAVLFSQGLARTWEALLDFAATAPPPAYATTSLPHLTAAAPWICGSGAFEYLLPPDAETFPIFEQTLGKFETLGRFSWEGKRRGKYLGWFNFGDGPGDGGWSNLETMADHEIFLHYYRTLSREHYEGARLAAEHYRDVDIDHRYGYCHTHCSNHTASGEGWSHAWIQGLRDLYFLTGDGRSLAVMREVGERIITKEPGFTSGRDWTRPIDDLVDIYQATGEPRFLDCLMAHLKVLAERQEPATGVCGAEKGSWYENRYEAGSAFTWYGCLAMAKLHGNVGGDALKATFLRELDLSLDVEKKGRACFTLLPEEKVSPDERALVIGGYTLGRGSVLFPALGYALKLTGDRKYLRLGMDVLAHCLLNQRSGSDNSATSFITAFLREAKAAGWGPKEEAEAFARAREYSWAGNPRELTNGGFEEGQFAAWSIKKVPGQDFYWDPIVSVGYYLDEQVKLDGKRSLRIHSDNRRRVISATNQTALPAGRQWRVTLWNKADQTMTPTASYSIKSYEGVPGGSGALTPTGKTEGDWRELAGDFMTMGKMVLTVTVGNRQGTGDVWFDRVELHDLGERGYLLTENGVGHEGREPAKEMVLLTGGSYLPDQPMFGDVKKDGPILFTEGCLTDGDANYDYSRQPCSYAYWERRKSGELLFDLNGDYRVERLTLKVNCDSSRRAHGTSKIELLPAEGEEPIAVIEQAVDGWNTFDALNLTTRRFRLRLHQLENRSYLTIAEIQVWGRKP